MKERRSDPSPLDDARLEGLTPADDAAPTDAAPVIVPQDDFWKLPQAAVTLPREGPPAMSPRARRRARELKVPLQALPIPAHNRRITEREVLAAAEHLRAGEAPDGPPRYPAEREALSTDEIDQARAWTYSQRCIPQATLRIVVPAAPALALVKKLRTEHGKGAPEAIDLFLLAVAKLLCDENFRAFRSTVDGADRILRGAINIGLSTGAERRVLCGVDRLQPIALVQHRRALFSKQSDKTSQPALFSTVYMAGNGVSSIEERVFPGESGVLTIPEHEPRPIQRPGKSLEIQPCWQLCLSFDRRLATLSLAGEFLKNLQRLMECPVSLV